MVFYVGKVLFGRTNNSERISEQKQHVQLKINPQNVYLSRDVSTCNKCCTEMCSNDFNFTKMCFLKNVCNNVNY